MRILLLVLCWLCWMVAGGEYTGCKPIDSAYRPSLPDDYHCHWEQPYDSYWYMGVVADLSESLEASQPKQAPQSSQSSQASPSYDKSTSFPSEQAHRTNKTFGFLFGLDRCSTTGYCALNGTDSSYTLSVSLAVTQDQAFFYNVLVHQGTSNTIKMRADPLWLHIDPLHQFVRSNLKMEVDPVSVPQVDLWLTPRNASSSMVAIKHHYSFSTKEHRIFAIDIMLRELMVQGTIDYMGRRYRVAGTAFTDRFWSSVTCAQLYQTHWTWMFLQLSNHVQLWLYQEWAPHHWQRLYVLAHNVTRVDQGFALYPLKTWTSSVTSITYTVSHQLVFEDCVLYIDTLVHNNEMVVLHKPYLFEATSLVYGVYRGQRVAGTGATEHHQPTR